MTAVEYEHGLRFSDRPVPGWSVECVCCHRHFYFVRPSAVTARHLRSEGVKPTSRVCPPCHAGDPIPE